MTRLIGMKHSLAPLLASLSSLARKFRMYPEGHPSIDDGLERIMAQFEEQFKNLPAVVIGIGKDRLFIDEDEITGDDWVATLCGILHGHSVSQVSFKRGVSALEISRFLSLLQMDPLEAREQGGYIQILKSKGISSIQISEIDYTFKSETEADDDPEEEPEKAHDDLSDEEIWRKLAFSGSHVEKDSLLNEIELFSDLLADAPRLAVIFESAIVKNASKEELDNASAALFNLVHLLATRDDGVQAEKIHEQAVRIVEAISSKSRYLLMQAGAQREGESEAQVYFTVQVLGRLSDRSLARGLLEGCVPSGSDVDSFGHTFEYYVSGEREPRILDEIEDICRDLDARHGNLMELIDKLEQVPKERLRLRKLKKIFKEAYEQQAEKEGVLYTYVEENLKDISDLADTMSESYSESAAFGNLFATLELTKTMENYEFYAQGLDEQIDALIHAGRYRIAAKAVKMLRRHARKSNPHKMSKAISRKVLINIRKRETAQELLEALSQWGKKESKAISSILKGLGAAAHEPALKALLHEKNRAARAVMIEVLERGGDKVVEQCTTHLKNPQWFVVRNMVALLAKLQPKLFTYILRDVIAHPEPRVRKEIARALSMTKDTTAIALLEKLVNDEVDGVYNQAVLGLGRFRGKDEAALVLSRVLDRKAPFGGNLSAEELAIRTLGRIRCECCLEVLSKYVLDSGLLSGYNEILVRAAVQSIAVFDTKQSWDILKKGTKSWNKIVRQTCQDALEKAG